MTPVFRDTVGLIAVWERSDQWHLKASAVFEELLRRGRRLVQGFQHGAANVGRQRVGHCACGGVVRRVAPAAGKPAG